jgi:hypothetical protein
MHKAPFFIPSRRARTLHLVDVENLVGGTNLRPGDVREVARLYRSAARIRDRDHVIVASSHHCAPLVWFEWDPSARRLVRSGSDGAELALLAVVETERPVGSFDRLVIGSGDGIFAETAARLQQAGVAVSVVTRPEALSRRLRFAVRDVRYLVLPPAVGARVSRRAA